MIDEKIETSPIVEAALKVMEKSEKGLEVKIVGGIKRSNPGPFYPLGQLQVPLHFKWMDMEEEASLSVQMCEDMLSPHGSLIAQDIIHKIFYSKLTQKMIEMTIDEAYDNYVRVRIPKVNSSYHNKKNFIERIKSDENFSSKWKLSIKESTMTFEEKIEWVMRNTDVELENLAITEKVHDPSTPNKKTVVRYKDSGSIILYEV